MDVDCILYRIKGKVLEQLQKVGSVAHPVVPDTKLQIQSYQNEKKWPLPTSNCGDFGGPREVASVGLQAYEQDNKTSASATPFSGGGKDNQETWGCEKHCVP